MDLSHGAHAILEFDHADGQVALVEAPGQVVDAREGEQFGLSLRLHRLEFAASCRPGSGRGKGSGACRTFCICRRRSRSSFSLLYPPQHECQHVVAEPAEIDRQPVLGVLDLALFGQLVAQLPDDIHHLGYAGAAHRVAARFQAAGEIDRYLPSQASFTRQGRLTALALLEEADVLALGDLQDGEGIVQLGDVDIGWLEFGHIERFLRCQGDRF